MNGLQEGGTTTNDVNSDPGSETQRVVRDKARTYDPDKARSLHGDSVLAQ